MEKVKTLRELRKRRGFTQVQVAQQIGMSQGNYSELENGTRRLRNLTLATGQKLAEALGVTIKSLLRLDPKEKESSHATP